MGYHWGFNSHSDCSIIINLNYLFILSLHFKFQLVCILTILWLFNTANIEGFYPLQFWGVWQAQHFCIPTGKIHMIITCKMQERKFSLFSNFPFTRGSPCDQLRTMPAKYRLWLCGCHLGCMEVYIGIGNITFWWVSFIYIQTVLKLRHCVVSKVICLL